MAAYALAKIKFPGKNGMFQLVQLSLMFNATVTTITSFILMSELHWLDTYWALIVPAWGSTLGLYLMKQFMDTNVNDSVLESARLDGAREFRIFWTIAMPMVKPAWLTLIIYSFQGLWNAGASMYIYSEQYKSFIPLEPIVSMMLDCDMTKTVIGTSIIMTCDAADAPARLIPPAVICPMA